MKNFLFTTAFIAVMWQSVCVAMQIQEVKPSIESLFAVAAISADICKNVFEDTAKPINTGVITKYFLVKQALKDNGFTFLSVNTGLKVHNVPVYQEVADTFFAQKVKRDQLQGSLFARDIERARLRKEAKIIERLRLRKEAIKNRPVLKFRSFPTNFRLTSNNGVDKYAQGIPFVGLVDVNNNDFVIEDESVHMFRRKQLRTFDLHAKPDLQPIWLPLVYGNRHVGDVIIGMASYAMLPPTVAFTFISHTTRSDL